MAVTLGGGSVLTSSATLDGGERAVFVPIAPCRLLDTRPAADNVGPRSTPLGPGDVHVSPVRGTNGNCTIPTDAVGVAMNVAIVNPSAASFLTVYPADAARPLAANLNWVAGQDPTPNAVVADLSADGRIAFYNLAGTVDLAVDVNGYFVDHTHDDRYYTKAQVYSKAEVYSRAETYTRAEVDAKFVPPAGASRVALDSATDAQYYLDLAIGTDGNPVIAYWDATNFDLKVVKCSNLRCTGVPTITTVDSGGNVGQGLAIAVGTDGNPIISYFDQTNTDIKVAKCVDPACAQPATFTPIELDAQSFFLGAYTDIAIAPTGLPVVVHESDAGGGIRVTTCSNQACTESATKVTNQGLLAPSLAFGTDGAPVISSNTYLSFDLLVTKCSDAVCTSAVTTPVDATDDVGHDSSIAVRPGGTPIVSYADNTNDDLKVASCLDAGCTSSVLTVVDAEGAVGFSSSIVIGRTGNPVISYEDSSNGDLKVAVCGNPSCTGVAAVSSVDGIGGLDTAVEIGADALPVVAHFDVAALDLRVAKCGSLTCDP